MCSLFSFSLDRLDADVGSVLAGDDWRGCDGAGDFRVDEVEGIDNIEGGRAGVCVSVGVDVDVDTVEGVPNSTGLVRGVAWTLVINLALEQ